jgi:hypothetical protein
MKRGDGSLRGFSERRLINEVFQGFRPRGWRSCRKSARTLRCGLVAGTCLLAVLSVPLPVLALTSAPAQDAVIPAGQPGVLSFAPDFFSQSRPTTAGDMVGRVPGFVMIEIEQDVRGLSGATGNILVDGQAPSLKSVSLRSFLQRIPAGTVERIDLIRGGAPGIDMQGQPVVVNIIRRSGSYSTLASTAFLKVYPEGDPGGMARIEAGRRSDTFSLEATLSFRDEQMQMDSGEGPFTLTAADGALFESGDFSTDFRTRALEGGLAAEIDNGFGILRSQGLTTVRMVLENRGRKRVVTARQDGADWRIEEGAPEAVGVNISFAASNPAGDDLVAVRSGYLLPAQSLLLDGDAQPVTLSAEAPAFDACGSAWKKDPVSGVIGVE